MLSSGFEKDGVWWLQKKNRELVGHDDENATYYEFFELYEQNLLHAILIRRVVVWWRRLVWPGIAVTVWLPEVGRRSFHKAIGPVQKVAICEAWQAIRMLTVAFSTILKS